MSTKLSPQRLSVFLVLVPFAVAATTCGGTAVVDGTSSTSGAGGAGGAGTSTVVGQTVGSAQSGVSTGGQNFASCATPGSCALANNTCCSGCGEPTLDQFDAVNEGAIDDHRTSVCPEPQPCPECPTQAAPNLFAFCDLAAGECRGANLPETEYAVCQVDSDCVLRNGLGCCTCGPSNGWVSVAAASIGSLEALLCAPDEVCAECDPQPPPGLSARCSMGRCQAVPLEAPPGG